MRANQQSNINSTDMLGIDPSSSTKYALLVNETRHLNCFLNSVIQLFARVEPFKHIAEVFRKSYKPDGDVSLEALQILLTKVQDCGEGEVIDPKELRRAIFKETYTSQVEEIFDLYSKGDSNEVLIFLL